MPAYSVLVPWGHLLGAIALETVLLFVVAVALQRFLRAAAWRRTLWQVSLLGLGLIVAAEVSGARRLLVFAGSRESHPDSSPRVAFEISTSSTADVDGIAAKLKERGFPIGPFSAVPLNTDGTPAKAAMWWPGWVWLSGFGAVAIWMVVARLLFVFFVHRRPLNDEATRARVDALAGRLGLRRRVTVAETPGLAGPIAFGIFRPGISLPAGFSQRFTPVQQEAMLAHELAHLAARDPVWHALADALAALLWWHPVVWMARRQLRAASEAAADEASLLVENGPAALAECLVELGGRLTRARSLGWLGMEGGEFRSGLGRRVKRLVALPSRPWTPIRRTSDWLAKTMGVTALAVLAFAATAWLQPREARSDSFSQAFKESVIGLALVAAMPVPQADGTAIPNATAAEVLNEELHTRWFKVDPTAAFFVEAMRGWLGTNAVSSQTNRATEAVMADLRQVFALAGVDLVRPKSVIFNEHLGQLMVRATLQEMEIVEETIQILSSPMPQVTLEVKICEVPEPATQALGFDWFLGRTTSNAIPRTDVSTGILTDPQYRVVIQALEQRGDVKVTTLPKVTTLSGRQAQIKVVQVRSVVTHLDHPTTRVEAEPDTKPAGTPQPVAESFELGPIVDVVPVVRRDGNTVGLAIKASVQEFVGYDLDGGTRTVTTPDGRKELVASSEPNPVFRKRELASDAVVWDGQTVVLSDGSDRLVGNPRTDLPLLGDLPFLGRLFRDEIGRSGKTKLVIFVTPTLIDAAGNRKPAP